MAVEWTIQGESGKAWDDTTKTFEEREISDASVEFKHLDADVLQIQISAENIATVTLPELEQQIVVYRNDVRFFTGNVTNRVIRMNPGSQIAIIQVSGPWWWMDKIQMTSAQEIGASPSPQDRLSLLLGEVTGQSLQTSLETVINRSVELGVPISKTTDAQPSTVATMGNFSQITLNQMSCAATFAEVVRNCPDAMTFFDYSQPVPALRVVRRKSGLATGSAATITLDANIAPITQIDMNPILGLEVQKVIIKSLERDVTGRTLYATPQEYPTTGSFDPEKIHTFSTSGAELDTFLPDSLYDTVYLRKSSGTAETILYTTSSGQAWIRTGAGYNPIETGVYQATIFTDVSSSGFTVINYSFGGAAATLPGTQYYFTDPDDPEKAVNPPDWAITQLGLKEAQIIGMIWGVAFRDSISEYWYQEWQNLFSGNTPLTVGNTFVFYRQIQEPIPVWMGPSSLSSGIVYREPEYTYVAPPAGMAQFLQEAQGYLPYEGTISISEQDVGETDYRGKLVNVSNSMTEYATMGALVSSVQMDIKSGSSTITFGQPPRHDFRNIMDRMRKTSQDNVIMLQTS